MGAAQLPARVCNAAVVSAWEPGAVALGRPVALRALLWDVDGTLAETERDGHRPAFNRAFAAAGLPLHWSEQSYGSWLRISGGQERISSQLRQHLGRQPDGEQVRALQQAKQEHYRQLVQQG
ncbi:MAG: hypothetical protein VKM98_08870, partial [Cyanobacteriota bacterium]|nr:hypothetical protein [Cyanobacteriota bacterium]